MEKTKIISALKELRNSKKRNFEQSVDLIILLKNIDLKKTENQKELFLTLPKPLGKNFKVCAFVGLETYEEAKNNCEKVILDKELEDYAKNTRLMRKIAREYDFFIAQANIMPQVASVFGKVLAPRGKMPNPKAGSIFPPKAALKPIVSKLKNTVKISIKKNPMVQVLVGTEKMSDEDLAENITAVYEYVVHNLPGGKNNIRGVLLKLTMSPPVKLE
ncbi:MAG: 50S ribosomal protein L1 [Candidatus Woesearchaeota archaeon]